jgi:hypothetical protein
LTELLEQALTLAQGPEVAVALRGGTMAFVDPRPAALRQMTAEAPTTAVYNIYLYHLARVLETHTLYRASRPWGLFVETGTDRGRSALHVACGWAGTRVVSIDVDPVCSRELADLAARLQLYNVTGRTNDSILEAQNFEDNEIDVLFLDSLHTYEHLKAELAAYLPKVRSGGLIILDDIHLNPGMEHCWHEITLKKHDVSHLHYSGFGLVGVP